MDTISKGSRRKLHLFSSIRTKFALLFFTVIAVLLVIMNTYFLTASRDMIFKSKETFMKNQANLIATNISASFDDLTVEGVNSIMDRLDVDVTGQSKSPFRVRRSMITIPAGKTTRTRRLWRRT